MLDMRDSSEESLKQKQTRNVENSQGFSMAAA